MLGAQDNFGWTLSVGGLPSRALDARTMYLTIGQPRLHLNVIHTTGTPASLRGSNTWGSLVIQWLIRRPFRTSCN